MCVWARDYTLEKGDDRMKHSANEGNKERFDSTARMITAECTTSCATEAALTRAIVLTIGGEIISVSMQAQVLC